MTYSVIDLETGEYPDLERIALKEEWAKGLMYCDMEGFGIEEDGTLILIDECGRFAYCPEGRFEIIPYQVTNADRIRAMTDEELAEWMAKYCERKTDFCPNFGAHDCQESCEQCWLGWLRTEVTE